MRRRGRRRPVRCTGPRPDASRERRRLSRGPAAPPGNSFASLNGSARPATRTRPHETSCIFGDSTITDETRVTIRGLNSVWWVCGGLRMMGFGLPSGRPSTPYRNTGGGRSGSRPFLRTSSIYARRSGPYVTHHADPPRASMPSVAEQTSPGLVRYGSHPFHHGLPAYST